MDKFVYAIFVSIWKKATLLGDIIGKSGNGSILKMVRDYENKGKRKEKELKR